MLKTPYFREGLDGEAVEWACQRLLQRDAARRILLVISDGSPMDSATNLANDEFYLDNHLKNMVEKYDRERAVEIYGIGVGLGLGVRVGVGIGVGPGIGVGDRSRGGDQIRTRLCRSKPHQN